MSNTLHLCSRQPLGLGLAVLIAFAGTGCGASAPRAAHTGARQILPGQGIVAPSERASIRQRPASGASPRHIGADTRSARLSAAPALATPEREPAQVLRIWIAPWEDSAGNLHGASHVFTEILPRRWRLGTASATPNAAVLTPLQIEPRPSATPHTAPTPNPSARGDSQ